MNERKMNLTELVESKPKKRNRLKVIITESQYNFIKRRIDWIDPMVRKEMRDQEPCYYKLKFGLEDGMEKYFKTVIN